MAKTADAQRNRLASMDRRVSVLDGEARTLAARRQYLETEVGLAKGRLSHKSKVDAFLEELQAEAHARRVGDFEKLLTALVAEVLPTEAPIGLELEIERGQPSLDIVSRHSVDRVEDIYDDQGGALTNVVSMGLRMIAVVRSGMQRFLMLDESDCWISNKRVPAFYSVLKEAARKVDVQCFAISHHDVDAFGEGINTATLSGHPEMAGGVRIENSPRPYRWQDHERGIRWIRLKNFQGYVDETFLLAPGVNALSGENNIGKSSFVRAFRAVFYGEARDSLIRRGERQCSVEIGFSHGRVLHWNRQIKRNPINLWKFLGPDGAVISEDGMTYETGGRTVPEWVSEIFKIGPVEGLDVHATKQKTPVFLLDKPGSTRAAVLSVGQESGHIRKMIALHKETCARDATTVKEGEAEMSSFQARVEKLVKLSEIQEAVTSAEALLATIDDRNEKSSALEAAADALANARIALEAARRRSSALSALPGEADLRTLVVAVREVSEKERSADGLNAAVSNLARARAAGAALSRLPDSLPDFAEVDLLSSLAEAIASGVSRSSNAAARSTALATLPEFPELVRSDDAIRAGRAVKDGKVILAAAQSRQAAYQRLPEGMPAIIANDLCEDALAGIAGAKDQIGRAQAAKTAVTRALSECEGELEALVAEMGHSCPLCSQQIDDAAVFLNGHSHHHEDEAAHG